MTQDRFELAHWQQVLLATAQRLIDKKLLVKNDDYLSLRVPASDLVLRLYGGLSVSELNVQAIEQQPAQGSREGSRETLSNAQSDHAHADEIIYRQRQDVNALAFLTPRWGSQLPFFSGLLPPVFDEVVRHIGPSAPMVSGDGLLIRQLPAHIPVHSNAFVYAEKVLCLGMTPTRLVLNAELFEKSCKAFVLAAATGKNHRLIPLWVRFIAHRRLRKDQAKASLARAEGRMPEEINSY